MALKKQNTAPTELTDEQKALVASAEAKTAAGEDLTDDEKAAMAAAAALVQEPTDPELTDEEKAALAAKETPELTDEEKAALAAEDAAKATPAVITKDATAEDQAAARAQLDADAAALAEAEGKPAPAAFVSVRNTRKTDFRQPSTGLWIGENETKELKNDGWLANQVKVGLLELV